MTTLTTFLMDRITEDVKAARDCKQWGECFVCETHERYDTDRILAECEAKLVLLADWRTFKQLSDRRAESRALPQALTMAGLVAGYERAAKTLALPYASHPDYREEWSA